MAIDPTTALRLSREVGGTTSQRISSTASHNAVVEARAIEAQALIRLGNVPEAKAIVSHELMAAATVAIPNRIRAELLLYAGQIATRENEVETALRRFHEAYEIFQASGEHRWQANALLSIAQLYTRGGDANTALKYYAQSSDEYTGDALFSLSISNNRGNAYLELSKPAKAEVEFLHALRLATDIKSDKYKSIILINLAQSQINQDRLASAAETIRQAAAVYNVRAEGEDTWQLNDIRAQLALKRDRLREAKLLIERAFKGVDVAKSPPAYRQAHDTAFQIYRALGDDAKALAHLEARARIDFANAELTASTSAALMAARFNFANQNLKISQLKAAQLEKSVAFERARSKLQRNLLFVSIGASLLVGSLLIAGLILITRSRNRERAARLILASTNRELEKAIAAKMEFLATTSHEIRTPLNGILGMTQVMLADRKLDATTRDRIGVVHTAGENMRSLVDDILDVAKMETGKLHVGTGTIELKATLRQVAQVWRLQAEAAGIALVLQLDACPEQVEGDGARLRQIVFNLLSNAMKFTEKGKVEIGAAARGDRLQIWVRDSGIGIAREWHDSIFELFQQVDGGTTRRYGGTGLGLAICRNLAHAMGGDITVESEPGFGSTFTIDLPLVLSSGGTAGVAGSERIRTVLVVERNPLTRGLMRAILTEHYDVVSFVDGCGEAADALAHGDVDMVIADAGSIDNWAVLRDVTPLVLIESTGAVPEAARAGARHILTKPLSRTALVGAISGEAVAAAA